MGLFKKLFGGEPEQPDEPVDVPPPKDALFDNDTPAGWDALEQKVLPPVAQALGLTVQRPDDDRILLRGTLDGAPFRTEVSFGYTVEHEIRFENRRGVLSLHWDYDNSVRPFESDDSDPMPEPVHRFIAPRIYMREFPNDADRMTTVVDGLPADTRTEMVDVITRAEVRRYEIDAQRAWSRFYLMDIDFTDALTQAAALIDASIRHTAAVARVYAEGSAPIQPLPRVYVGSRPPTSNDANQPTCSFCHSIVSLEPGRCPNCGAPITHRED